MSKYQTRKYRDAVNRIPTEAKKMPEGVWRLAVLDECALCHMPFHENDPRRTLREIIKWHSEVSLDPQVSEGAQALIKKGKREAYTRVFQISLLLASLAFLYGVILWGGGIIK